MFRNCGCSCKHNECNNNTSCNEIMYENNNCNNDMYETSCNINSDFPNMNECPCACGFDDESVFPQNWMYGHSYVPHQKMNKVYTPEIGLKMGTIFPELVSPYCPGQSLEVINYLKKSNTIGGGCNS